MRWVKPLGELAAAVPAAAVPVAVQALAGPEAAQTQALVAAALVAPVVDRPLVALPGQAVVALLGLEAHRQRSEEIRQESRAVVALRPAAAAELQLTRPAARRLAAEPLGPAVLPSKGQAARRAELAHRVPLAPVAHVRSRPVADRRPLGFWLSALWPWRFLSDGGEGRQEPLAPTQARCELPSPEKPRPLLRQADGFSVSSWRQLLVESKDSAEMARIHETARQSDLP